MVRPAPSPIDDPDAYVEYVSQFSMPIKPQVAAAAALARAWFKPRFVGLDNLPTGPALFVGNHAFMALDAFVFHTFLYYDHGRYVKGIGDKTLFANPHYASLAHAMGAVSGQAPIVQRLMAQEKDLLLYPGGAYESVKPPEALYQLQWKERYGFVRLAAEAGYTVVPIASVGPDEYYNHALSAAEVYQSAPVQALMRAGVLPSDLREDLVPPLPAGMLGGPLPKPKTSYFAIGKPISLSQHKGKALTMRQLSTLRRQFAKAIDREIRDLLVLREQERHKDGWLRRLLSA